MENKKECYIGIDQSYHSTGMTIQFSDNDKKMFFQFTDTNVKHSASVICCVYPRIWSNTEDFSLNEQNLIRSSHNVFRVIYHYVKLHCSKYDVWNFAIEGQIMSGFSSHQKFHLTDLLKLVTIIEYNIMKLPNAKLQIFTPKSVKKYFTANGNAKKEDMIKEFSERFGETFDYNGKIDDVVDSYALCEMIKNPQNYKEKKRISKRKKTLKS